MKKETILYAILTLLSFRAFGQTDHPKGDIFPQGVIEIPHPGITLVLKKLRPIITLKFSGDDLKTYSIVFFSDKAGNVTLAENVNKDDAQHVQLKDSDFDGANLQLSFADGKLTGIGTRTLETPVTVQDMGTNAMIKFTKN
jgi:hypothetical protein